MGNLDKIKNLTKNKTFSYGLHSAILIYVFCCIFGVTSTYFFNDIKLMFFLSSLLFAGTVVCMRDSNVQYKDKSENKGWMEEHKGTFLVMTYTLVYGISGFYLLKGIELSFFVLSYMFATTMFYLRSPDRIYGVEFKLGENGLLERHYLKKDFKYYLDSILHKEKKEPKVLIK